jgi:hypothetical protein
VSHSPPPPTTRTSGLFTGQRGSGVIARRQAGSSGVRTGSSPPDDHTTRTVTLPSETREELKGCQVTEQEGVRRAIDSHITNLAARIDNEHRRCCRNIRMGAYDRAADSLTDACRVLGLLLTKIDRGNARHRAILTDLGTQHAVCSQLVCTARCIRADEALLELRAMHHERCGMRRDGLSAMAPHTLHQECAPASQSMGTTVPFNLPRGQQADDCLVDENWQQGHLPSPRISGSTSNKRKTDAS